MKNEQVEETIYNPYNENKSSTVKIQRVVRLSYRVTVVCV